MAVFIFNNDAVSPGLVRPFISSKLILGLKCQKGSFF